jgi:uncharacterized ParB-like nuclease family protein
MSDYFKTRTNASEQTARFDFDRARMKMFVREVLSWVTHDSNDLLPYDDVRKVLPLKGQYDLGIREIPLDHIVGSVNRSNDFDRAFLPRVTNTRGRWMSIDKARIAAVNLPAIEVIKVGEVYFVKDGNHRVSVARENGQAFIDAYVTEILVPLEITPESNLEDIILKQEKHLFEEKTDIKELIPESDIQLTQVGQYSTLLEHISVHRWYMGEKFHQEIGEDEAVKSWYVKVYLPIVQIIRKRKILDDFPGHTEADLYLWIVTHQYFLTERKHGYVTFEQAASHFVNKYSRKPIRRIRYELHKIGRWFAKIFGEKK